MLCRKAVIFLIFFIKEQNRGGYFRVSCAPQDKHLFGEKQERDGDHRRP
jgi:hypothetical protein